MLKILQVRIEQYLNWELPDEQTGFRKGRWTRDQIANIGWIIEKQENVRKMSTSPSLTMLQSLTVWITTNCGKILKRWQYQTILTVSWKSYMQVKKQQLEPDMLQLTGSNLGKEYIEVVRCQPTYLTYMQSASHKMTDWMMHKLKSRLSGEISKTSVYG